MKGLFIGDDIQCYTQACELSLQVNFTMVEKPLTKVIVNLCADEFHSTWLGNKAIYRTRMAIATGGSLIILAPGIQKFGEDNECDKLIRKYGYSGTPKIMKYMSENRELQENLSAVAHLIHGSTEGRFEVTYCTPNLSSALVESVGFMFGDLPQTLSIYEVETLVDGMNNINGEDIFYISNPALGLWAHESRLADSPQVQQDEEKLLPTSGNPLGKRMAESDMDVEQVVSSGSTGSSGGVGGWANKKAKI